MNTAPTAHAPRPTVVLRLNSGARLWQASARAAGEHAPGLVRALLAGRTRVELSCEEAEAAIAWARQVPGWDSDGAPALVAYELDGSRPAR